MFMNSHFYLKADGNSFPLAGLLFPLCELLDATEQKKGENLLGRGGYGSVYKGVLRHTVVAVKFLNEVLLLHIIIGL